MLDLACGHGKLAGRLAARGCRVTGLDSSAVSLDRARADAAAAAKRPHLPLPRLRPRHIDTVRHTGDHVVTVCDLAHEGLAQTGAVHWSIPDPVPAGDPDGFDTALKRLADRIARLAPRLTALSWPAAVHRRPRATHPCWPRRWRPVVNGGALSSKACDGTCLRPGWRNKCPASKLGS